jgi:hypothetical protein
MDDVRDTTGRIGRFVVAALCGACGATLAMWGADHFHFTHQKGSAALLLCDGFIFVLCGVPVGILLEVMARRRDRPRAPTARVVSD